MPTAISIAPKPWGGFGFYFLGSRATAYAKHPGDTAWLFDVDTMKPRVNNPAWVRAIQDVIDALPFEPPDQINADPNTTGFQQFLAGTGSMVAWWGDIGSNAKTSDASVIGDVVAFDILPGSDDVYNATTGQWETLPTGPNYRAQHGLSRLGHLRHGPGRRRSGQAQGGLERRRPSRRQGHLALDAPPIPPASSRYRNSHFNIAEWVAAGYDEAFISNYLASESNSYNHPNAAIEPRIPGHLPVLQRGRGRARQDLRRQVDAQTGADNIAAAWEKLTDQIGRDEQIELYKASLGRLAPPTPCGAATRLRASAGGASRRQPIGPSSAGREDRIGMACEPEDGRVTREADRLARGRAPVDRSPGRRWAAGRSCVLASLGARGRAASSSC